MDPWSFNSIKENPFDYYSVNKDFKITKISSIDLVKFGKIGYLIQSVSFSISAFLYTLFKKSDVIYSRDELPLFFISFFKKSIFWEIHMPRWNFIARYVSKKCSGIITITHGLRDFYVKKCINPNNILVASDGVDIWEFSVCITNIESRKRLNLLYD